MVNQSLYRVISPLVVSVLVLGVAFYFYAASPLVLVALIGLYFFLSQPAVAAWPTRRVVLVLWLAGLLFSLIVTSWIVYNNPEDWAQIGGLAAVLVRGLGWLLVSLGLSVTWLIFGLVATRFRGEALFRPVALVVLPAAWVIGEYLKGWVVSVLFWGPGGTLGAHWHFGNLAFAAAASPLGYASRLVGLFGLAWLVVLINLSLFWLLRGRSILISVTVLASVTLLSLVSWSAYRPASDRSIQVGVLHTVTDATITDQRVEQFVRQETPPRPPLDVLVLPEYSALLSTTRTERERLLMDYAFQGRDGLVIWATDRRLDNGMRSRFVTYRDQAGSILAEQDKRFLIPGGEYPPLLLEGIVRLTGNAKLLRQYAEARQVQPGRQPAEPFTYRGTAYGALACSGIVTPDLYRKLSANGAEVLANSASLTVIRDAPALSEQNKQMARFQAVANAKPFIQGSRAGHSYVIDADGHFLVDVHDRQLAVAAATVKPSPVKTLYTRFGDWAPWMSLAILLAWLWRRRILRRAT